MESLMPNFRLGKRQRELAKKQKREEKKERKAQRRSGAGSDASTEPQPPVGDEGDPTRPPAQ